MRELFAFFQQNAGAIAGQTLTHVGLTFASLALALLVGLPVGVGITRLPRLANAVLGFTGALQTIPSVALLGFLIPLLGIGPLPAVFALFLYALLPIVRNTYVGITEVNPTLTEAARGMGMTDAQVLRRVELPLALPVIFAGVRTATVINVGVATLAAYIAAGGLGEFIFSGIALNNPAMILAGALPAAALAIGLDWLLARAQRHLTRRTVVGLAVALPLLAGLYYLPKLNQTPLYAGFAHEFAGRADGYPGLQKTYGLRISHALIDQNLMYEAVRAHRVDVISGYSTDGRIRAYDLRVLTDDRGAFPPYQAAALVRQATLDRLPALQPTLERLAGLLTDAAMTDLNYRADFLHQSPARVATDFLRAHGLWRPARLTSQSPVVRVGSKIFTEQYVLAEVIKQLIEGQMGARVESRTGLGGTQLCFNALRTGAIDLYPEYTGTGLLVILGEGTGQARLSGAATLARVRAEFGRRYGLRWLAPLGFNNAYCLMMRRVQARQWGINNISDLTARLANPPKSSPP